MSDFLATQNAELARKAASQGMVLLENKADILPLNVDQPAIALFGVGAVRTVRGGTGSGDPFNGGLLGGGDEHINQSPRYHIHIFDAMVRAGFDVVTTSLLQNIAKDYDVALTQAKYHPMSTFAFPDRKVTNEEAMMFRQQTDTAIYVLSRNSGEGKDRDWLGKAMIEGHAVEVGDYLLSTVEFENIHVVASVFPRVILVLNVGGVIDMKWKDAIPGIGAVLLMSQAGQEGGDAFVDIVLGRETPSGKLTATWAKNYEDYPTSATFAYRNGDVDVERYEEGIYVGYRYFDSFSQEPYYPFGYGLSYTTFAIAFTKITHSTTNLSLHVTVTNSGEQFSGREVVQVYVQPPTGLNPNENLERAYQQLAGFCKTKILQPGEHQDLIISFDMESVAYFDEETASYRLEKGLYYVSGGNSSRHTTQWAVIQLVQDTITEIVSHQYSLQEDVTRLRRQLSYVSESANDEMCFSLPSIKFDASDFVTRHGLSPYLDESVMTYTTDFAYVPQVAYEKVTVMPSQSLTFLDVAMGRATMENFVAQMSLEELASLTCGTGWGVSNEESPVVGSHSSTVPGAAGETTHDLWEKYGIPSMVMADGPAGIRVKQEFTAKHAITGEEVIRHQYCTAWPVGVLLAQSFDEDLLFQVGQGMAHEAKEIGVTMILGPGMNIQRDPLCGRNFEYYAEDPLVSGLMAAAMTRGIQSIPGVGACLKHFAANNQETNRDAVNALLHERTLREIYLKGFEIAVKKANPMAIMTSYNLINGVPTADSYDLNMNLARGEWGFQGLIMTDWNGGQSTPALSMHAGNDLIMPGGVNRVANIIRGAKMIPPSFDDRGQIRLRKEWFFGDVYDAMWNSFIPDAETDEYVEAVLGEGKVASLQAENILVDGEPVYFYDCHHSRDPDKERHVLTTKIARIDDQGKKIIYRGKMVRPFICRGDVQRSAKHILNVLKQSLAMQQAYPNEPIALWSVTK